MSQSHASFWRVFAAITFLNQIVRVPLLLFLANSAKDLEVYFVISATSIPVQFIAQDILQYRSKTHRQLSFERIGLPLFAIGSIAYVAWHHGFAIGCSYLIFAVSILLYGASVGYLRDIFSAKQVLAMDALYNTGTTLVAVTSVLLTQDGSKLGYSVIFSQAGMAVTICIINLLAIRRKRRDGLTSPITLAKASISHNSSTPLILSSLMATTQLERLIIAASQPAVLVCISLAAGVVQAWRKVGMDDAVVFERLRQRLDEDFYHAMRSELIHARLVFYPPLLLSLIASVFIYDIANWLSTHGFFRSLDSFIYLNTLAIICIYLAAMPPAIVMINTLRQRIAPLHQIGWSALIFLCLVELLALIFPYVLVKYINLAMVMIVINAGLSHVLFMSLCPVQLNHSFRLLRFDIVVFAAVISILIWMQFL